MKKWWSCLVLSLVLVFAFAPLALAKDAGDKPSKKSAKVSGSVVAVDVSQGKLALSVDGKTFEFVVTETTELEVDGVEEPTLDDVWAGDRAKVEYSLHGEVRTAKEIEVKKVKGKVRGKVETIDPASRSLTVQGKSIVVVEKAKIRLADMELLFEDIAQGDMVEVSGFMKEGTLQAYQVKIKKEVPVVKGVVRSVNAEARTLLIDGNEVVVGEDTKIRLNGSKAAFENLLPGDKVVSIGKKENGVFHASIVSVHRKPVELEGLIESINPAAGTVTIYGITFTVNEQTKIIAGDMRVGLAALVTGMEAEIKALRLGEGNWLAIRIHVDQDEDEIYDDDEGDDDEEDEDDDNEYDDDEDDEYDDDEDDDDED